MIKTKVLRNLQFVIHEKKERGRRDDLQWVEFASATLGMNEMGMVGTHPGSFGNSGKHRTYDMRNLEERYGRWECREVKEGKGKRSRKKRIALGLWDWQGVVDQSPPMLACITSFGKYKHSTNNLAIRYHLFERFCKGKKTSRAHRAAARVGGYRIRTRRAGLFSCSRRRPRCVMPRNRKF